MSPASLAVLQEHDLSAYARQLEAAGIVRVTQLVEASTDALLLSFDVKKGLRKRMQNDVLGRIQRGNLSAFEGEAEDKSDAGREGKAEDESRATTIAVVEGKGKRGAAKPGMADFDVSSLGYFSL